VLEFADVNIERCAARMIALERVGEGLLVDDLTPGDVDEQNILDVDRAQRRVIVALSSRPCLSLNSIS